MRIIDMRPEVTDFDTTRGQVRVHNWSYIDSNLAPVGYEDDHGKPTYYNGYLWQGQFRMIYHYSTLMGYYYRHYIDGEWQFTPVSIGHGSVSDQGGMNQLMSTTCKWQRGGTRMFQDYGYYYSRDQKGGGARIERTTDVRGREVVVD